MGLTVLLLPFVPDRPIRPELFFLPKEAALGVAGFASAVVMLWRGKVSWDSGIDMPLGALVCWGALLTVTVATNAPAGWRALGTLTAAMTLFLFARQLRSDADLDAAYTAACLVVLAVSLSVLLEAFGLLPFFSEPGRRPGGPLGNRNLAARVLCLALPLYWRQHLVADRVFVRAISLTGVMLALTAIILSRSRGAWVVTGAIVVALPAMSWLLRNEGPAHRLRSRTAAWIAAVVVGISAALILPNRMGWTSADVASSAQRVFELGSGSGRVRLIQAETSWRMAVDQPLSGVGPGNWSTVYARYAEDSDPSLTADALYPAPPLPRSDLLGLLAEVGLIGLTVAGIGIAVILNRLRRSLKAKDWKVRTTASIAAVSIGGAAVLGVVDPVMRLAPTLGLLAITVGTAIATQAGASRLDKRYRLAQRCMLGVCAVLSLFAASEAIREVVALRSLRSALVFDDLYRAVNVAPHNVEARAALASALMRVRRCDLALPHLERASRLEPFSGAIGAMRSECHKQTK